MSMIDTMKVTPFGEVVGDSARAKILFFFFANPYGEFTKTDISKKCKVARQSVYYSLPTLLRFRLIRVTRKIGNTTLYKFDERSHVAMALAEFNDQLIQVTVDEEVSRVDNDPDYIPITNMNEALKAIRNAVYGFSIEVYPVCFGKLWDDHKNPCTTCDILTECKKYNIQNYGECPECFKRSLEIWNDPEGPRGEKCASCDYARGDV